MIKIDVDEHHCFVEARGTYGDLYKELMQGVCAAVSKLALDQDKENADCEAIVEFGQRLILVAMDVAKDRREESE